MNVLPSDSTLLSVLVADALCNNRELVNVPTRKVELDIDLFEVELLVSKSGGRDLSARKWLPEHAETLQTGGFISPEMLDDWDFFTIILHTGLYSQVEILLKREDLNMGWWEEAPCIRLWNLTFLEEDPVEVAIDAAVDHYHAYGNC